MKPTVPSSVVIRRIGTLNCSPSGPRRAKLAGGAWVRAVQHAPCARHDTIVLHVDLRYGCWWCTDMGSILVFRCRSERGERHPGWR